MKDLPEDTQLYGYLQRPSLIDFPGHIAAVYFSAGCNFRCGYCHNAEMIPVGKPGLTREQFTESLIYFQDHDWITGVVFSGGEATINPHILELVRWVRKRGLSVKLDTNGSRPDVLKTLLPYLDYVAMDVKCSLQNYESLTGYARTELITTSIELLKSWQSDKIVELRTTVLSSLHSAEEIEKIGNLIEGSSLYRLQPFVPRENIPDPRLRNLSRTPPQLLEELRRVAEPYVVRAET
jgi:pyruvate formate lyase activating enzyme